MGRFLEFIGRHWVLSSALVVIVILLVMDIFKRRLLGFQEVKPLEAVRLINQQDAVTVDVRDDKEYNAGHVLNAVHIPLGLLDERMSELDAYRTRPVIVYCHTGPRAAKAAAELHKQGFAHIYKMSGGIVAWQDANLPVTTTS